MIIFDKKIIENNQNTPLLSSENYGIIRVQKAGERPPRETKKEKGKKMQQVKVIKVKPGRDKLREEIKNQLARKGARAGILIGRLGADKESVIWKPTDLDAIASELRYLAFQIRNLQQAKLATEEA